ncbi:hypothetical protein DAETH_43220 (plasmid) [Deinococcus aetherius]|uniref:Uncharacterized protein n=2 Tax=Deinococcus aetherius TaxID=200252 RepID=A0ABM8AKK3_9DEIO|nr:hypothetical protein DAETH_43220 [Deinococcus aetherius]
MTPRVTRPGWLLLGVLALVGVAALSHGLSANAPGVQSRAGVGWCPAAGTAPMPVACVPRP